MRFWKRRTTPETFNLKGQRGRFDKEVVGESHYADTIKNIVSRAPKDEDGWRNARCVATLHPEPENAYDDTAIRVEINGKTVGYLPRTAAAKYFPVLTRLNARGLIPQTGAEAGFGPLKNGKLSGSVWLDLGNPKEIE